MNSANITHINTVVVADDHAIVREGVCRILLSIDNTKVVAEADNGLSAISLVSQHQPDLLVLDAGMPRAQGIEVFLEVRKLSPQTRVILFTGFTSLNLLSNWLAAGVDGILLKSSDPSEMELAFRSVLEGGSYLTQELRQQLEQATPKEALRPREREVLALIASGNMNAQIADRLNISQKTVEKHRGSLMQKLNVHSVTELMVYALREGLLDDQQQS